VFNFFSSLWNQPQNQLRTSSPTSQPIAVKMCPLKIWTLNVTITQIQSKLETLTSEEIHSIENAFHGDAIDRRFLEINDKPLAERLEQENVNLEDIDASIQKSYEILTRELGSWVIARFIVLTFGQGDTNIFHGVDRALQDTSIKKNKQIFFKAEDNPYRANLKKGTSDQVIFELTTFVDKLLPADDYLTTATYSPTPDPLAIGHIEISLKEFKDDAGNSTVKATLERAELEDSTNKVEVENLDGENWVTVNTLRQK